MDGFELLLIFWGGLLLIPLAVDGVTTASHFLLALRLRKLKNQLPLPKHGLPKVSIVIPAYNEAASIDHCLLGVRAQTYPQDLLEVIVVDDGSQDGTTDIVLKHIGNGPVNHRYLKTNDFIVPIKSFGGTIQLIRRERNDESGKPAAFNAGLAQATGEFIIAVDADIVLAPDAVENALRAFLDNPAIIALTGHLVVDSHLVVELDENGEVRLDQYGIPIPRKVTLSERVLTACQFMEYISSFHLGRRLESYVDGLFTVAGACAAFRADVFRQGSQFSQRTVSEDADMTLGLHRFENTNIRYLPEMRAHLSPCLSWSELYSQRLRWQRGALEVSSIHMLHDHQNEKWMFWNILLPLRLQINHTLIFPRTVWILVLLLLPIFGYTWGLIGQIIYVVYLLYLIINTFRILVGYLISSVSEKIFIRKYMRYLPLYPLYNTFLLWVYLSASIQTLTENAKWKVETPLLSRLESLRNSSIRRNL